MRQRIYINNCQHFFFLKKTDYDEQIRHQRGQIIQWVTAVLMTIQHQQRHHNISGPQHRSQFHHTFNPITLVREADVVIFDQDHSINSTKSSLTRKSIIMISINFHLISNSDHFI